MNKSKKIGLIAAALVLVLTMLAEVFVYNNKLQYLIDCATGENGVVDGSEAYDKFAKYADSINPIKVKRHTVLSVHPIDYYTMSFGNSWTSCHCSASRCTGRDSSGTEHCYHVHIS